MEKGRYDRAVEAFRDAAEAFREQIGPTHQWTTQADTYRAWCYLQMGELDQAIRLYESVFNIEQTEAGRSHDRTIAVAEQLAEAYERAGRPGDAARVRGVRKDEQ